MNQIEIGVIYEHYKGTKIKVIGLGFDSESLQPLVFYIHLEDGVMWARPQKMFLESVKLNNKKVKRFKKVKQKILIKPNK
jgi:hypothetical protein